MKLTVPSTQPLFRHRSFLVEWLFVLGALFLLGGYISYSQYQDYIQTESQERERLASQAALIEKNLGPQIFSIRRAIDSILESLPAWEQQNDGFILANQRLQVIGDTLTGIRNILIINAEGRVLSSNNQGLIGRDLFERDYFQNALKNPNPRTLYVTPPFTTVLNTYVMSFYRIIQGPKGNFAGIVIASVDPAYFKTLLDSVRYTHDAWAYVAHGDGKLFMIEPEGENQRDMDLATPGSLFTRHRESGEAASVFAGNAYRSGKERMIAFRTIQPATLFMDKPLVVTVSRDLPSIFGPWYRDSEAAGGMFGIIALVAILSLFFYQRRQRALDRLASSQEQKRKQAEADLRVAATAFESQEGIIVTDADRVILRVNCAFTEIAGYTAEEAVGRTPGMLKSDRHDKAFHEAIWDCVARTGVWQGEIWSQRKSGEVYPAWIRITAVMGDAGKIANYVGTLTDITKRKAAEDSLRASEERYRVAFRTSRDSININRVADGCYVDVNQGFERVTGWRRDEVLGKTSLEIGVWVDVLDREHMLEMLSRDGFCENLEIRFRRKDQSELVGLMSVHAISLDGTECLLSVTHDITERKTTEEEIRRLAFYDSLTLLPNRQLLIDRLRQALASSTRSGKQFALLFIDLDNFKTLNDSLGHNIGDLLLQQAAQRILACTREGDTVARLGGDEFVVMLEDLSESAQEAATQAEIAGRKILATLNQTYQLASYEHHSTASIGITLFADHQETIEDLLKRADLAMYQAKAAGRNTLRFFDPAMQTVVTNRAALEADLREAVLKGQLVLYYQAQVDGKSRLTGAEALLRWQHPQRGLVPPLEFIPLAEDTGLILPLGDWVLETACVQLAAWAARPELAHLTVAVNVSARQLHHSYFVDQVLAVLDRTGANPHRLKLELTETLLVQDAEDVIAKMTALKAQGVGFSLDDFGTGYSSLSYLKRLPLDQLKIDRSFVRDILIDPNDAAIAKMVVALAESLGLAVIAEGVETVAQRDFLARHGCHAYQGYLFSHPLPLEEFEKLVRRGRRVFD